MKSLWMFLLTLLLLCMFLPTTVHADYNQPVLMPRTTDESTEPDASLSIETLQSRLLDIELSMIPVKDRLNWLFPDGLPTSESQAWKHLKTIEVTVFNGEQDEVISLHVHEKLADTYIRIFDELYRIQFPIHQAGCFSFRKINNGTNSNARSHHSYGVAIDINYSENPHIMNGHADKTSIYYIDERVVEIFKAHGFYWGGDWSERYVDPMHFTFTNN